MIQTLKNALRRAVEAVQRWLRPVVVQLVRQVVYIQRPALKAATKKPRLCSAEALRAAGQIELF